VHQRGAGDGIRERPPGAWRAAQRGYRRPIAPGTQAFGGGPRGVGGFSYFLLLLFVAVSGFALVAVAQVWVTLSKREKEKELVFVLGQFQQALLLYSRGAATAPQPAIAQPIPPIDALPQRLEDLLQDPRAPNVRRYLRRIYVDPMTGKAEWGVVQRQGRIIGVHSLSQDAPLGKKYELAGVNFEAATKYSDWQVAVIPTQQGGGLEQSAAGTASMPGTQPAPASGRPPAPVQAPQPVR
jgi:type II secretory pathway pseudopilin PulG